MIGISLMQVNGRLGLGLVAALAGSRLPFRPWQVKRKPIKRPRLCKIAHKHPPQTSARLKDRGLRSDQTLRQRRLLRTLLRLRGVRTEMLALARDLGTGPRSRSSGGGTATTTRRPTRWRACCRGSSGRRLGIVVAWSCGHRQWPRARRSTCRRGPLPRSDLLRLASTAPHRAESK
jgi:hypothetical protein